jgi:NhaP-type Na+/H+ or K+/H+ antiporter
MDLAGIAVVAAVVFAYALVSRQLTGSPVTLPIVFAGFGWLAGSGGLGIAPVDAGHGVIHVIAELTLILVLFTDAARMDVGRLVSDHDLPMRMLAIGLPLTVVAGTASAFGLFPNATLASAFLVSAILAPTDAALGQSVVSDRAVPVRIRQALNVESGLNDGLALPIVLVAAALFGSSEAGGSASHWLAFAAKQVVLGPLAGVAAGYVGVRLIQACARRGWMTEPFKAVAILSVAILAYTVAELIGGNGFIAAFIAGLMLGGMVRDHGTFLFEFMEGEGQLLTLIVFFVFGAVMLPEGLANATWSILFLALLFLTVIRMLPVALSLIGTRLSLISLAFLGWFGPRGIASILFALLILEREIPSGGDDILACVVVTVALSIVLHGLTAAPFSALYGAYVKRRGECAEVEPVSEMRLRYRAPKD